jgi:hypothetical protein
MPILLGSGIIDLGFSCGLVWGILQLEGNRKWEMGTIGWSGFGSRKWAFSQTQRWVGGAFGKDAIS